MSEPARLPRPTPPGWYPEPVTRRYRWWDGIQWAFYAEGTESAPASAASFGRPVAANGVATASLVLGIVGVVTCTLVLPSVLAVIFGIAGLRRAADYGGLGRGKAITGIVLGGAVVLIAGTIVAYNLWISP